MKSSRGILPQDNLFRAVYALPTASEDTPTRAVTQLESGTGRTLELQWSVVDQWTEINSRSEGNFMERIATGASTKTIQENRDNMRILLQHGRDPQIGNKPISTIDEVGENGIGGFARGELFPGLDPLVVDGLRAGQYGASFRFGVTRDELVMKPKRSDYNPKGLPERTVREMAVPEFGPVTWGAYSAASAGVRSITDEIHFANLISIPEDRLLELVAFARGAIGERVDSWDLDIITQMLSLGGTYAACQYGEVEADNVATMKEILTQLTTLAQVEVDEDTGTLAMGENSAPDSDTATADDESRRIETPVEAPAEATPTTDRYLSKRQPEPGWYLP